MKGRTTEKMWLLKKLKEGFLIIASLKWNAYFLCDEDVNIVGEIPRSIWKKIEKYLELEKEDSVHKVYKYNKSFLQKV